MRRSQKAGLPPGTLVHIGERKVDRVRMEVVQYDASGVRAFTLADPRQAGTYREGPGVAWVNVIGVHDLDLVARLGEALNLHPLTLEDITNTEQRPKMEDYPGYIFLVVKMLEYREEDATVTTEQISIVLTGRLLVLFQERPGDMFAELRKRIRNDRSLIRSRGVDYLLYAVLDCIVDSYFRILEQIGEDLEELEDRILGRAGDDTAERIQVLKRALLSVRRAVWPLRDVVNALSRNEVEEVGPETRMYFRDVYDHTVQVIDTMESYREMIAGLLEIYLSAVSNRLNEVMKMLTIIATVFIPLTFITGVYGMNFRYMPELHWRWAYPAVWGVMALVAGALILYFRRKKWL